ncbi:MAG: hypothetical protein LBH03_05970 [Holophagales bacterium]|nr:hypothetical protein [Holophagales bacterium]
MKILFDSHEANSAIYTQICARLRRNGASRRQAESEMGGVGGASPSVLFVKGVDYSHSISK